MSEAAPRPTHQNSHDIIAKFRLEYSGILADAGVSEQHTSTAGWQRLYKCHEEHMRQRRRELAKRLRALAERMEDFGLSEEDEKDVRDAAKMSAEAREAHDAFVRQTVDPVRMPVGDSERVAVAFQALANRQEQDAPLVNVGLAELMRIEIARQPRIVWDEQRGTVSVVRREEA